MKKITFAPLILVVLITLWSFAPAPVSSSLITLADGSVIIPSSAGISTSDQNSIVSIVCSYGSNAGYLVYKNSSNVTVVHNPLSSTFLSKLDLANGSDLANGDVFSGYVSFVSTTGVDDLVSAIVDNSGTTAAMAEQLAPILANYQ